METGLEKLDELKCNLTVTLPQELYKETYQKMLKKVAKTAKVDGFRKGNVPNTVVEQQFGARILDDTINVLINDTLAKACEKEGVKPVNTPSLIDVKVEEGKPFSYVVTFEVAPSIEKINFENAEIEKIEAQISAEDIEQAIHNVTKQFGQFKPKASASVLSDRVLLDFEGSINGEEFNGGAAKNQALVLGEGKMIPGFEEQIVGMQAGDEKTITVTFPKDYAEDLAGKEAQFKIKVHEVQAFEPAILDAELIKKVGVASGELNDLHKEVEKTLTRELKNILKQNLQTAVFGKLAELNPLPLPSSIVHDEVHALMDQAHERLQKMFGNKKLPKMDLPHEMFEGEAKQRVLLSYLVLKIVADNNIKADPEAVQALAEEWAASYENPTQVRDYYLRTPEQLRHLENIVIENSVLDYLVGKAKVNVVEKTYAQLAKNQKG